MDRVLGCGPSDDSSILSGSAMVEGGQGGNALVLKTNVRKD